MRKNTFPLYTFWSNHWELARDILKIKAKFLKYACAAAHLLGCRLAFHLTTEELIQIYFSRKLPRFLPRLTNFFFFFFFLKFLECLVPRTSLNDCFCSFFPLSALFLKKKKKWKNCLRKIAPLPSALEYSHWLLSFSNILPKFYPRWIKFYGMKSNGILQGTWSNLYEI